MSPGAVFVAHKKCVTKRNSHLAGETNESSISNTCQVKTERRSELTGMVIWGGTRHAPQLGS